MPIIFRLWRKSSRGFKHTHTHIIAFLTSYKIITLCVWFSEIYFFAHIFRNWSTALYLKWKYKIFFHFYQCVKWNEWHKYRETKCIFIFLLSQDENYENCQKPKWSNKQKSTLKKKKNVLPVKVISMPRSAGSSFPDIFFWTDNTKKKKQLTETKKLKTTEKIP